MENMVNFKKNSAARVLSQETSNANHKYKYN